MPVMDPQRQLEDLLNERYTFDQFKNLVPHSWSVVDREISRLQSLLDKSTPTFYPGASSFGSSYSALHHAPFHPQQQQPAPHHHTQQHHPHPQQYHPQLHQQHHNSQQPHHPQNQNQQHPAAQHAQLNGTNPAAQPGAQNPPLSPTASANAAAGGARGTPPQQAAGAQSGGSGGVNPQSSAVAAAAAAAAAAASANVVSRSRSASSGLNAIPKKRVKLPVPADKYPDYNFVGRLLGPRGATLKFLERDTGCKIMIRGKGSIRKDKENEVRGKPGWEHVFNEPLHVVVEADCDEPNATKALNKAKEAIELLLVPVPEEKDSLKRQQLRDLAILNGTFRGVDGRAGSPPGSIPIGAGSGALKNQSISHPGGVHSAAASHHLHPNPHSSPFNSYHSPSNSLGLGGVQLDDNDPANLPAFSFHDVSDSHNQSPFAFQNPAHHLQHHPQHAHHPSHHPPNSYKNVNWASSSAPPDPAAFDFPTHHPAQPHPAARAPAGSPGGGGGGGVGGGAVASQAPPGQQSAAAQASAGFGTFMNLGSGAADFYNGAFSLNAPPQSAAAAAAAAASNFDDDEDPEDDDGLAGVIADVAVDDHVAAPAGDDAEVTPPREDAPAPDGKGSEAAEAGDGAVAANGSAEDAASATEVPNGQADGPDEKENTPAVEERSAPVAGKMGTPAAEQQVVAAGSADSA